MSEASQVVEPAPVQQEPAEPGRVILVAYPKIVFLYPIFLASLLAAIYMSITGSALDATARGPVLVSTVFLVILCSNLVVLGFDFPRTTSLTLFFFVVAVVMAMVLLFTFHPEALPALANALARFRPLANAAFYWALAGILGAIFVFVIVGTRFDYWEVRPNELLHHHGFLSNLERFSAPNLRIDKEINDIFEYMLLRSGRLILQSSNERRAIILDNVVGIRRKEEAITRMLSALHVQICSGREGAEQ
jgi:hypothetical protein